MRLKKAFAVGFLGNVFEWYDFSVFAYLAVALGKVFFPSSTMEMVVLKSFAVFSISYLIRPLGSVAFGMLGDKKGRAYALKLSMLLMAAPAFFIGLLPGFSTGGIFSIVALIALRLLQGFAAGGELPGSACYLYEASDKYRALFCSFISASSMFGVLCGSLATTLLYFFFQEEEIVAWAWRIPFLSSALVVAFLCYIRKDIKDSRSRTCEQKPLRFLARNQRKALGIVIAFSIFTSVSFYLLFVWMPSYLRIYLDFSSTDSLLLSTVGLTLLIFFTIALSLVAKKIGEKNLIIFSILSIMLIAYPAFVLLGYKSLTITYCILIVFAFCLGSIDSVIMKITGDLFLEQVRCSGISIGFTIPTAIFGGLAPSLCGYLIYKTGWTLSPVMFLIFAAIAGLVAACFLYRKA